MKLHYLIKLSLLILFPFTGFAQSQNRGAFRWNDLNTAGLVSLMCGLYSNKSETLPYRDQFQFHQFRIQRDFSQGKILVTGECGMGVDSDFKLQEGGELRFEMELEKNPQNPNPILMGVVGSWGVRLYFKTLTEFDGQKLQTVQILDRVSLFSVGVSAARALLKGVGLLDLVWYGSESISPAKYGISAQWNDDENAFLDLEGLGARNAEAVRLWSNEKKNILMNTSDLVSYWARGEGRPQNERGDAIFFQKFGSQDSSEEWMGCSYFVESAHRPIDEATCRSLWLQVKPQSADQ